MILTQIERECLGAVLARFATGLRDRSAQSAFARIARTGAERAAGAAAERHRLAALGLARRLGIAVRPGAPTRSFGWDGRIMRGGTEAYVLLHEIAHWQLANARRRRAYEFGLGPGPETGHRAMAERATLLTGMAREREEAMASLLGILWETALRQPALASFLDQNWLEGAGRPGAAKHFETALGRLVRAGLVDRAGRPVRFAKDVPPSILYPFTVTPGLDPGVQGHPTGPSRALDRRVKPGDDALGKRRTP